jgi:hypothetical protein
VSAAIGLGVSGALAAAPAWSWTTRALVGWDLGAALYLLLAFEMMARSDVHRIRRRAASEDEGQVTILTLTVAAARPGEPRRDLRRAQRRRGRGRRFRSRSPWWPSCSTPPSWP